MASIGQTEVGNPAEQLRHLIFKPHQTSTQLRQAACRLQSRLTHMRQALVKQHLTDALSSLVHLPAGSYSRGMFSEAARVRAGHAVGHAVCPR